MRGGWSGIVMNSIKAIRKKKAAAEVKRYEGKK
jgi:hypothetical protein